MRGLRQEHQNAPARRFARRVHRLKRLQVREFYCGRGRRLVYLLPQAQIHAHGVSHLHVAPELNVVGRGFELLLDFHLQDVLVVVVVADERDPVNVLLKHVLNEDLRHLEPGARGKHVLKPVLLVPDRDLVVIQEQRAHERLKQAAQLLQVRAQLLLLRVPRNDEPPVQPHLVRHAPDGLVLHDGDFLLRHEALVLLREAAIKAVLGDALQHAVAEELQALVGLGAQRHAVRRLVHHADVFDRVLKLGAPRVRLVHERALVQVNVVHFRIGHAVRGENRLNFTQCNLAVFGVVGVEY